MRAPLIAALLLLPVACEKPQDHAQARTGGPLRVVTTTGIVADLVRVVGGDRVAVESLMGPGVDPHLYKASQGDLRRLRDADLVVYSGKGLEGKMTDVLVRLARDKAVVAATDGFPEALLIEPPELQGHYDPHVWLDASLWSFAPGTVAAALAGLDTEHADGYRARAEAYRLELLALHNELQALLETIPRAHRVLVTSHDAFRYFGRAYGLEVHGVQGISTVADAGIRDIESIAGIVVSRGVPAIFLETSIPPRTVEAVQAAVRAQGGEVAIGGTLYGDALDDKPPADTLAGMLRANATKIAEALR